MTLKFWSPDELQEMFPDKTHLTCPACATTKFQKGPKGGLAVDFRCENGHYWNVSAFGMEELGPLPVYRASKRRRIKALLRRFFKPLG